MGAFTRSTDLIVDDGHAITYAADGDHWTVGNGITVLTYSRDQSAIFSQHDNNLLFNNGNIFSGDTGVDFRGDNFSITAWVPRDCLLEAPGEASDLTRG
jgi:hypothetical protein